MEGPSDSETGVASQTIPAAPTGPPPADAFETRRCFQRHLEAFEWRDRANTWAASHDKHQVKARIPPSIEAMFDLWFTTVDLDAGGTISTDELVTTLAASGLPAEREAVEEFVRFMDTDCSGEVDLAEFKSFMCEQMSRGHAVNEGTVMLPTGEVR